MAESTEGPSIMSDEDTNKLCKPCTYRGIHKQAGTHCQDCLEDLCDFCEKIHLSFTATRDHKLKPFDENRKTSIKQRNLISATMTCEDHRSEVVSLLCLDHNEPYCQQCKLTKHRKCKTETLHEVAEKSKEEIAQFAQKFRKLTSMLHELKGSREQTKETLQSSSEELIIEIKKFKKDIVTWANNLERDMLDGVESTKGKLFNDIDEEVQTAGEMVNQLEKVANSLDILGPDVPSTSLVITLKEQRKLDQAEEIRNDILKVVKPEKMSFVPSRKLVTALSEIKSMGTLTTGMKDESNVCFQDITSLSKKETINVGTSGVTSKKKRKHDQGEKVRNDILKDVKPKKMRIFPSRNLVTRSLNTGIKDKSSICFQDITSLSKNETINAGTEGVTGCVFMPNGELWVCDGQGTETVKVLTRDFQLRHEIKLDSWSFDVAVVSQDEVIVTQPHSNILQVLKVSDTIEKGKSFPVDMKCWGVDCKNDMIYVSCHSGTGHGGTIKGGTIKVLSMTGVTLSSINIDQEYPSYLAVNSTGDRIMISTQTSLVLCTDTTGKALYTYKDRKMNFSRGMMFDSVDNVMVCGMLSNNIHVVKKDGTKHRVILTSGDGMIEPLCLAYRADDGTLLVGQRSEGKSLIAFTVKM